LNDSNTPEEKPEGIQETPESPLAEELPEFDATELMLHGNLVAQIRYSMIKGLAEALDEKAQLLIEAESNFEPQEDETFAEIALPEIEAMAEALTDEWIDFSKIRYWESCQTAEVEWEEFKDENGEVKRMPYTKPLEEVKDGNRLLANLEQTRNWLEQVHLLHEEKGMGWVSPHGCPEDGQHAYEARRICIEKLNQSIDSIRSNFDI
jgi:hypothetical protein